MQQLSKYNFDAVMAAMKKRFHEEIVKNFNEDGRTDLLAGYLKSALNSNDRKYGQPKYRIRKLESGKIFLYEEVYKRESAPIMNKNEVSRNWYAQIQSRQGSSTSPIKILENAYNQHVVKQNRKPNNKWEDEINSYISQEYLDDVKECQDWVCKRANPWDMYLFAAYVPCSDVQFLQDEIIKKNNPLPLIEFASQVKGADLKKIRKAIGKITAESKQSEDDIDYLWLFDSKFGTQNDNQYQPE